MRIAFAVALLLVSSSAVAHHASPPLAERGGPGRDWVFLSPMGEPFRTSPDGTDGADGWFTQADANHDGALSVAEMRTDAARFFATLDVNHDGEIDPKELSRYETEIAPASVRMGAGLRPVRNTPQGVDGRMGPGGGFPVDSDSSGRPRMSLQGIPEPVAMADTNFNRGVSTDEFAAAATKRFYALDRNRDGKITPDELRPAQPGVKR